jgi:hypothetical protein
MTSDTRRRDGDTGRPGRPAEPGTMRMIDVASILHVRMHLHFSCRGCFVRTAGTLGRASPTAVFPSNEKYGIALTSYRQAEISVFLTEVKNGEFDDPYPHCRRSVTLLPISH